jgi:hypothetical protein
VKLFPKARRRRPGVYVYRTRRHLRRGTEWGYAGMSTNLPKRYRCHAGTCKHNCHEKPWYDLKAAYFELRLPWWLGWKWVLLSIETILIAVLRPRYNTQKNPRRSKVPPGAQQVQRAIRNARAIAGDGRLRPSPLDLLIRITAACLIVGGPLGYLLTR